MAIFIGLTIKSWPEAGASCSDLAAAVRSDFDRRNGAGEEAIARSVSAVVEDELVRAALEECDGNQVRAAKLLGISRNTLRKRMSEEV